jgi:hypothetical protein
VAGQSFLFAARIEGSLHKDDFAVTMLNEMPSANTMKTTLSTQGTVFGAMCMQFQVDRWLNTPVNCGGSLGTEFLCCTKDFGVTSVVKIERGFGVTKKNSPLFYCLVVDIVMLLLVYIGKVLDGKKMWLNLRSDPLIKKEEPPQVLFDADRPEANHQEIELCNITSQPKTDVVQRRQQPQSSPVPAAEPEPEQKRSFAAMFKNCVFFYSRLLSCFLSSNLHTARPFKALNLWTQL